MENQSAEFVKIFDSLKTTLKQYEPHLRVITDAPDNYYLDANYSEKWKKNIFFGAVQIKRNYVSCHLMPLYIYPELVKEISPELRKRMQGKSCFNFMRHDDALFREIKELVRKGADKFREAGYIE